MLIPRRTDRKRGAGSRYCGGKAGLRGRERAIPAVAGWRPPQKNYSKEVIRRKHFDKETLSSDLNWI